MKTNDFNQALTSTKLKENLEKQFGSTVNLGKYSREQLEDIRNKLRTRVFQQEGSAGVNDLLTNETYQKDKAMLQLLNTRIKEMLGENIKRLRDKMVELSEGKKEPKADNDYDGDGKIETGKEEHKGSVDKAIKKAKAEKDVAESFPTVADAKKRAADKTSKFDSKKISTGTTYSRKADKETDDEPAAKNVKEARADPTGSWVAYKSPSVFKKFKTREGAKGFIASNDGYKIASAEHFADTIQKNPVAESFPTVADAKKRAADKTSKFDSKKISTGTTYSRKADKETDDEPATRSGNGNAAFEGKDEGKPGKNFAKISKSAAEKYGSKQEGDRVAGAVRQKLKNAGKLESIETFRQNVRMVNEGLGRYLNEDEEGKAKAITAAGDMVNDFTSWMQRVGQYQTKSMIELADAIKSDFGAEQAEAFKATVGPALSASLEVLTSQREAISNAVATLATGQAPAEPMGQEPDMMEPGMDLSAPDGMNGAPEDEFASSDAAAGVGAPGREMRESAQQTRSRKLAESHSIMSKLSR